MKKTSFLAAAAALVFCACQGGGGAKMSTGASAKADLANDVDTICYVVGNLTASDVKTQAFSKEMRGMGLDSAYAGEFVRGLVDALDTKLSDRERAYMGGITMGLQLSEYLEKGIKSQLYGAEDSTHTINVNDFVAGFLDGFYGKPSPIPGNEISQQGLVREKMNRIYSETKAQQNSEYKKENEDFLTEVAKKEGVKELGDGIYYEVVTEGTGAVPSTEQQVRVHYEGKTIDGNVFDSSYERGEPIELLPMQVIPGWTKALTSMPVGSKWIVYIPYDQAYGEDGYPPIKGFSTLIFTIELLNIIDDAAE